MSCPRLMKQKKKRDKEEIQLIRKRSKADNHVVKAYSWINEAILSSFWKEMQFLVI